MSNMEPSHKRPADEKANFDQDSEPSAKRKNEENKHESTSVELIMNPNINKMPKELAIGSETSSARQCLDFSLSIHPFKCLVLPTLISEEMSHFGFIDQLKQELLLLDYSLRDNDLNKFQQSLDFNSIETGAHPLAHSLLKFFLYQVRPFLEMVFFPGNEGPVLNKTKISMSASRYLFTDYLLPHDDHLEDRMIAFIYYLVDNEWTSSDGGSLDFFESDSNYRPFKIVESIHPSRNKFVAFEVTPRSWHQVSQVLSQEKVRIAISGWFLKANDKIQEWPMYPKEILPPTHPPLNDVEEDLVRKWISPSYLDEVTTFDIQQEFEDTSEIRLENFLAPQMLELLINSLDTPGLSWANAGPPSIRKFSILQSDSDDNRCQVPIIHEFIKVMRSDAMFLTLSNMTGLKLHSLIPQQPEEETTQPIKNYNPRCRIEMRRWTTGDYSICSDVSFETHEESPALDVMLFIGKDMDHEKDSGGYMIYNSAVDDADSSRSESDEPLLEVFPVSNNLNIVYRDKGTIRFMKYLNNAKNLSFYELSAVYYE